MQSCNVDVEWIDIHRNPERLKESGASREFVRERLHVVDDAGVMRVGAEVFAARAVVAGQALPSRGSIRFGRSAR
jgi:hypothetical protein